MNADITMRIKRIMADRGYDQTALAEVCGLNRFTVNRYMNDKSDWSDKALKKIADTLGANFKWLRDGVGEMFSGMKREDNKRHAVLEHVLDSYCSAQGSVNTIHGEHNTGTQTINSGGANERDFLLQKVAMLEKTVADKDKEIAFLRGLLAK